MLKKLVISMFVIIFVSQANAFMLNNNTESVLNVGVRNPGWSFAHQYHIPAHQSVVINEKLQGPSELTVGFWIISPKGACTHINRYLYQISPTAIGNFDCVRDPSYPYEKVVVLHQAVLPVRGR